MTIALIQDGRFSKHFDLGKAVFKDWQISLEDERRRQIYGSFIDGYKLCLFVCFTFLK